MLFTGNIASYTFSATPPPWTILPIHDLGCLFVTVGQCDLDLGSSHYTRADTGLPEHLHAEKHPNQPDMLDAISTLQLSTHRAIVFLLTPDMVAARSGLK